MRFVNLARLTAIPSLALALTLVSAPGMAVRDPWSLPVTIPRSDGGEGALIEVANDGTAVAAWTGYDATFAPPRVLSSLMSADGVWDDAAAVTGVSGGAVDLDGGPTGIFTLLMLNHDGLFAVQSSGAGSWGDPTVLASLPGDAHRIVGAQVDASGPRAIVAWVAVHRSGPSRVMVAEQGANGLWNRPVAVSPAGAHARNLQVQVTAQGDALVVWRQGAPEARKRDKRIWLRTHTADGIWSRPTPLSAFGATGAALSVADDGTAVVGWGHRTAAGLTEVTVARRSASGQWRTAVVATRQVAAVDLAVVALPGGGAAAAWVHISGAGVEIRSHLWAAIRQPAGWLPATRVSAPIEANALPRLVPAPNGAVHLFWSGNIDSAVSGNDYLVMHREWADDLWGSINVISTGAHTIGDLDVAGNQAGFLCAAFGVYDPTTQTRGYRIQSACRAE